MDTNGLTLDIIRKYYLLRGLKKPGVDDALHFVLEELGEACRILTAKDPDYVRNNPDRKPHFDAYDFGEELGDAIMMLVVAGYAEGVDPIEILLAKMGHKCVGLFDG